MSPVADWWEVTQVRRRLPGGEARRPHSSTSTTCSHDTRNLLTRSEEVRVALAARYRHVLVDEFQDTDLLQAEIFWRLCGDPPASDASMPWTAWPLRDGALFMVGDPKQAIYRFRGADVQTYLRARAALETAHPVNVLRIGRNFRSVAPILDWVNLRFEAPLSADGQPGFAPLFTDQVSSDGMPECIRSRHHGAGWRAVGGNARR